MQRKSLSEKWQMFVVTDLCPSCAVLGRSGVMRNGIAFQLPQATTTVADPNEPLLWPTLTTWGRWPSEGEITQLRKKVDAGDLTVKEAECMIGGTITPPRMKEWTRPEHR